MDATGIKRAAQGFIGGTGIMLGVLGGVTGAAAAGAVTLSAPEYYDEGGYGGGASELRFAKSTVLAEQDRSGNANYRVGPTAEVV